MGFEVERFVDQVIDQSLLCPVCHKVLQDPVLLDCDLRVKTFPRSLQAVTPSTRKRLHVFCRTCIVDHFADQSIQCPLDDQRLAGIGRPLIASPPSLLLKTLNSLLIGCEFCHKQVKVKELASHSCSTQKRKDEYEQFIHPKKKRKIELLREDVQRAMADHQQHVHDLIQSTMSAHLKGLSDRLSRMEAVFENKESVQVRLDQCLLMIQGIQREIRDNRTKVKENDIKSSHVKDKDVKSSQVKEKDMKVSQVKEKDIKSSHVKEKDIKSSHVKEKKTKETKKTTREVSCDHKTTKHDKKNAKQDKTVKKTSVKKEVKTDKTDNKKETNKPIKKTDLKTQKKIQVKKEDSKKTNEVKRPLESKVKATEVTKNDLKKRSLRKETKKETKKEILTKTVKTKTKKNAVLKTNAVKTNAVKTNAVKTNAVLKEKRVLRSNKPSQVKTIPAKKAKPVSRLARANKKESQTTSSKTSLNTTSCTETTVTATSCTTTTVSSTITTSSPSTTSCPLTTSSSLTTSCPSTVTVTTPSSSVTMTTDPSDILRAAMDLSGVIPLRKVSAQVAASTEIDTPTTATAPPPGRLKRKKSALPFRKRALLEQETVKQVLEDILVLIE